MENNKVAKHIFAGSIRICSVVKEEGKERQTRYFHQDHIGSSNVITDKTGSQIASYEYTPFGELSTNNTSNGQGMPCPYLFTGKELDSSTGLYYYGARYYDPVLSHFISPDPIIQDTSDPQTLNHYAYCRNNPLIYTDPTGLAWGSSSSGSSFGMGFNAFNSWGSSIGSAFDSWSSSISSMWSNTASAVGSYINSTYNTINSWTTSAMNSVTAFGQNMWQGIGNIGLGMTKWTSTGMIIEGGIGRATGYDDGVSVLYAKGKIEGDKSRATWTALTKGEAGLFTLGGGRNILGNNRFGLYFEGIAGMLWGEVGGGVKNYTLESKAMISGMRAQVKVGININNIRVNIIGAGSYGSLGANVKLGLRGVKAEAAALWGFGAGIEWDRIN